jgi:NADPH:quinone reductase-like Zn-dependent oxidoreductase
MNRAIEVNALRPVIDRAFHFDEAPAAYRHYQDTNPSGRVVIAYT